MCSLAVAVISGVSSRTISADGDHRPSDFARPGGWKELVVDDDRFVGDGIYES
jgi:hypothetical protein